MTLKRMEDLAATIDGRLRADDPRFNRVVAATMDDGSMFFWDSAFVEEHTDNKGTTWYFVFCEHYDTFVRPADDFVRIAQYESRASVEVMKVG